GTPRQPSFGHVFSLVSWKDRALFSTCQAGLVNNLNDGMAWGLFPLYFATAGLAIEQVGLLAAIYPGVWGVAQLGTGALSDRLGRKSMIVAGLWIQAIGIVFVLLGSGFGIWMLGMALLGLGTAIVFSSLLGVLPYVARPAW